MSSDPPHDCPDEPGTFVLDVTTLAHGPDAVGRHEGRVFFVPGAAPGDRVRVRIVEQHGNYARAALVHRCQVGAAYREPPCPWVGECGGCPWQHVDYASQIAAKEQNVRETLRRNAGATIGDRDDDGVRLRHDVDRYRCPRGVLPGVVEESVGV